MGGSSTPWVQGGERGETYTLVVDDLNDGDQLALVRALGEDGDTTDFHQSPIAGGDVCVAHCADRMCGR